MNASSLKDMPVVSMADGAQLGHVKQIVFDPGALRAAGLLLVTATPAHGESLLPFASVRSIGADAIMVETTTRSDASVPGALQGLRGFDDLLGLPILSGEGTELGHVTDVAIDPGDGRITALALHRGGRLGIGGTSVMVEGRAIRGIGPTTITVEASPQGSETPASEPAQEGESCL